MEKLKPCPFCGGTPLLSCTETKTYRDEISASFYIHCEKCGTRTKTFDTNARISLETGEVTIISDGVKDASKLWNRRKGNEN